jgi:REP element-mobilizing transposase RayT
MPNHVHVLVTPVAGEDLEMILKQVKGASAVECNRAVGRSSTFWQAESYDHIVRSLEQLQQYRQYIADNPKKAGITLPANSQYAAAWIDEWFKA